MMIKLLNALCLAIGVAVAGPNVSSPISVDMDPVLAGVQPTIDLADTGTTFTVAIVAQNVTDLMGCEITFRIDTAQYRFVGNAYGSAFNNSMPNIWSTDSTSVKFTYARMAMTPQYLTATEAQLGTVTLKNRLGIGGSAPIRVVSGKFGAAGFLYDDFTAITGGTFSVTRPQSTVTVVTAAGGSVSPASISATDGSESGPITATPDACHAFKSWEVVSGAVTVNSPASATTTVTAQGNGQIRATYTTNQHTLTVDSDGNGTTTAGGTFGCGAVVLVQATPNAGYAFAKWTIASGSAVLDDSVAASTSATLSGNAAILAHFAPLAYTLSIDDDGDGVVESTRSVGYGAAESIAAATIAGNSFVNWTVSGGGTIQNAGSAATTVTVTGAATVVAHFAATSYTVNVTAQQNGTVSPSGAATVAYGDSLQISAIPDAGYAFVNWTVSEGAANAVVRNPNERTTWVAVTGPATLKAQFSPAVSVLANRPGVPKVFDLVVSGGAVSCAVPAGRKGRIKVTITDMHGKIIASRVRNAEVAGYFTLDLKDVRKGCYLCSMKAEEYQKTVKITFMK